jgi:DNA-binding LacI/PurR family transcriptional regulator
MPQSSNRKRGRPPNPEAQYRRVAAALRAEVESGELTPGATLSSLRALGRKYGVSYRTMWLAIDVLKSEGCLAAGAGRRIKVLPPGEKSASVRSPVLEVVSYSKLGPALENPIGWALHLGVGTGADHIDASLLTVHGSSLRSHLPEGFAEVSPRGVLLLGHFNDDVLRAYARTGLPTVLVDWPAPSWQGHSIYVDNESAMHDAVERLLKLGHRQIAFLQRVSLRQGDLDLDAKERARSMRSALKKAGVPHRRESVFTLSYSDEDDSPALARLLKARPAFTAVITSDNNQAARIIAVARAMGRSVPDDLSVVGFQALEGEEHAQLSGPSIDFEAMGCEAVEMLTLPLRPSVQRRLATVWHHGNTVGNCEEPGAGEHS